MSNVAKLRKKSVADLTKDADKLREEIAKITRERFDGDGKKYSNIRTQKKELARILTLITEKNNEAKETAK